MILHRDLSLRDLKVAHRIPNSLSLSLFQQGIRHGLSTEARLKTLHRPPL